ncbi:hypothetical protein [Corallococcus exercitus]|uniref:hypothetical protein n=1 Tax=Corallococcus exercitus TaxID=2316736 RepID=UPI0035D3F13C
MPDVQKDPSLPEISSDWSTGIQMLLSSAQDAATRAQSAAREVSQPLLEQVRDASRRSEEVLAEIRKEVAEHKKLTAQNQQTARLNALVELSKTPILTASILIAIYCAGSLLNIDLSYIKKIGPTEIEFDTETKTKLIALSLENDQNKALIEQLQKNTEREVRISAGGLPDAGVAHPPAIAPQAIKLEDIVSERTVELAQLATPQTQRPSLEDKIGFIWIGDQKNGSWTKPRIRDIDGRDFTKSPSTISEGTLLQARGALVLRQGQPPDNESYFRGVPVLGVLSSGTPVEAMGQPIPIDRDYAIQYWLKVKVLQADKGTP